MPHEVGDAHPVGQFQHAAFEQFDDLAGLGRLGLGLRLGDPANRAREAAILPVELAVPHADYLSSGSRPRLPSGGPRQPNLTPILAEESQKFDFCQSERGYASST